LIVIVTSGPPHRLSCRPMDMWYITVFSLISSFISSPTHSHPLTCSPHMLSIIQSFSCQDGQIGLSSTCQCDAFSTCHFADLKEYLPSLSLLQSSSWSDTIALCNHQLKTIFTDNIRSRSSFITSTGYPLDIPPEICQQKEELALTSSRRYHPCSVSIGKFLRYNSLFVYRLFGRGTRVSGYSSRGHHQRDTFVDLEYNYPWRWSQGLEECRQQNLTNWNCLFRDFSRPDVPVPGDDDSEQPPFFVVRSGCEDSLEDSIETIKKSKAKRSRRKNRRPRARELKETHEECEEQETRYSSVEIPSSQKIMKQLRDYRIQKPNHMSQLLLYGHLLTMLSRPSDPVWKFLERHLVYLPASPSASAASSAEHRTHLLKSMNQIRHGRYAPPPFLSSPATQRKVISVSMHVRQGDSCDYEVNYELPAESRYLSSKSGERPCYHVDLYMNKLYFLRQKYGVTRVYLATDSQEMLARIQQEDGFEWIYLNVTREIFQSSSPSSSFSSPSPLSTASSSVKEITKKWIDFYPQSSNSLVTNSAVCDLFLMRFGDIFLGAFTSHFSKLSYYLMIGTKFALLPFVSMDYPLSCDTVDDCTHQDIANRNQTIEKIINWAPECLRQEDGGWMRDERDPCGIYL
jgi:hypothetical protein